MSNPFVIEQQISVDQRDREIGPAWFFRATGSWERATNKPILSGGEGGGSLKSYCLEIIREAREMLLICSFLISDNELSEAILGAADRGVHVYILTASKDRIAKDPSEEESLQKQMQIEHEKMLNSLCSRTLLRDAQAHAKFILADPKSEDKRGILSTANFTTEAFHHPELGVILAGRQVDELFSIFSAAWWGLAERELLQPNVLSDARDIAPSVSDEIAYTTQNLQQFVMTYPNRTTSLRKEITRLLQESKEDIFISTYGLSDDDSVFNELVSSTERKKVKLLVRQRPKTTLILQELKKKGAEVRGLDFLHAKVICTETDRGLEALIMTANIEKISLQEGFEVGLLLKESGADQIFEVLNHWWDNANWEYSVSRKLGNHLGPYLVLNEREFEKHEVVKSKTIPLGEQVIRDLAAQESFRPDIPTVDDAHQVTYTWTTHPLELPKTCKPHKVEGMDDSMRIWKCDKNRIFISVSNQEELQKVLRISDRPNVPVVYHSD